MIPQLFDPWLITEPALRLVFNVATRNAVFTEDRIRALEERAGKPLANTRTVTVRDGVAVIPVQGTLFRHASLMSDISGGTAYATLAKDHAAALADPLVREIAFYFDSPGGLTSGCFELAAQIRKARGTKRQIAIVEGDCASAAYALASACDEIWCSDSSNLGCIGAVMSASDRTAAEKMAGELKIEFVSSISPDKRPDIKTADGRAIYQKRVDDIGDLFATRIAEYRGVSLDHVINKFGQGSTVMGADAVAVGLADRLADFESALADMAGRPTNSQGARMSAQSDPSVAAAQSGHPPWTCSGCKQEYGGNADAYCSHCMDGKEGDDDDDDDDDEKEEARASLLAATGAKTVAEARGTLAAMAESHAAIAAVRAELAAVRAEGTKRDLRAVIEAGLASGRLSPGKVQRSMAVALRGPAKAAWSKAMGDLKEVTTANLITAACSVELTADDVVALGEFAKSTEAVAAPNVDEPPRDPGAESEEMNAAAAQVASIAADLRKREAARDAAQAKRK